MNSDTVIAGVVASSTGPCDEMVIDSVAELTDLYLNGDSITADSDVTIQHAAKILQFSPIHIVRAANDSIKAGVTNLGDVIYTNKNYVPFKYSKTWNIVDSVKENVGFIGFTDSEEKRHFTVWKSENGYGPDYLSEIIVDSDKVNGFLVDSTNSPSGIDSLFAEIKKSKSKGIPQGVSFDFSNSESHVVYTNEDMDFDIYPGQFVNDVDSDSKWFEVSKEDICDSVFKLEVTSSDNAVVNEGEEVITLNGHSFYLGVSDESKQLDLPGTGVEIKINREEGSAVSPTVFALYLFDELVKNDKFKNPVMSKVDASMSFEVKPGTNKRYVRFCSNMDDVLSISYVVGGEEHVCECTESVKTVEVTADTVFTIKPCVEATTLISDERYFFINISDDSTTLDSENVQVKEGIALEGEGRTKSFTFATGYAFKDVISEAREIKLTVSDGSGYASGTTILLENGVFSNWTGTLRNISAKIKSSEDAGSYDVEVSGLTASKTYTAKIEYELVEFIPNSENSKTFAFYFNQSSGRPYFNKTIHTGSMTIPMAAFQMGVAMKEVLKKEGISFVQPKIKGEQEYCEEIDDQILFYGLKSKWRTLSSKSKSFEVSTPSKFVRSLVSKDSYNTTSQKGQFVLKLGNIVLWNGKKDAYIPASLSEDSYQIGSPSMTFNEFIAEVNEQLPSFASVLPTLSDGSKITVLSNSEIDLVVKFGHLGGDIKAVKDSVSHSFDYELSSRFAVIASYPSKTKIFGLKMLKKDDETFDITVRRKSNSSTFNVSFTPGAVNGYGTGIYFDYINSDMIDFKAIDLNMNTDPVEIVEEISFGDEIVVPEPGLTQRKDALSKFTLETGYYYNYITELGYTNASYDIFANSVAESLHAQYIYTAPKSYLTKSAIIQYRDTVGVDSRSSSMFVPFYKDNTLGNFIVDMSPSVQVLQRLITNKKMFKEFSPAFGPSNGEVAVSTKMSSSSGLLVDFNKREDREEMLSKQVNMLRIDRGLGIVYINDTWTCQKKDSYLSDFNNMYMTNLIQHVLDTFLKQYFASANNKATRDNVVIVLTKALNDRIFANQQYTPYRLDVICDESNNPMSVVNDRKLVVDVKAFYEVAIKYIETYTRVLNLSEA